jgi:AcrR family transcriptional regulator
MHPTKQILLETAVALLDELPSDEVTSDTVLRRSGISKGSLYHHFPDYGHLIDDAEVIRFARYVDGSIDVLTAIIREATTAQELVASLKAVTRATQSPGRQESRRARIYLLGLATQRPHLQELLGREQQRLTEGLADLFREAQARGWFRSNLDPMAAALLVQTYSLGLWLDDITPDPVHTDSWVALIDELVDRLFLDNTSTTEI